MARVGTTDFYHSVQDPTKRDQYYREVMGRSYWHHPCHALQDEKNLSYPSHRNIQSEAYSASTKPWKYLKLGEPIGLTNTCALQTIHHPEGRMPRLNRWDEKVAHPGQDAVKIGARSCNRQLHASASCGQIFEANLQRTSTHRDSDATSRAGSVSSISVASSGRDRGLSMPRHPRRHRNENRQPEPAIYHHKELGPSAIPRRDLCGPTTQHHDRMPSFGRIYGN
jgi:hypothetical protein